MREEGYYWTYNNQCWDVISWEIYYWDGHYFWRGDEDFGEDTFEKIDEKQINKR